MTLSDLETSRIVLRPIEESDYPVLHKWRNESRFLKLFSSRREVVSFDTFTKESQREFERNRHMQFIVERKNERIPIGTIYSFSFNQVDGYIYINIYIDELHENRGYGAEAVTLLVCYLFKFLPIHKIYFEAFEYNGLSISTLRTAGFYEEGRFKEHRFFEGKYHDVFRFAAYRNSLEKLGPLLERFQNRKRRVEMATKSETG